MSHPGTLFGTALLGLTLLAVPGTGQEQPTPKPAQESKPAPTPKTGEQPAQDSRGSRWKKVTPEESEGVEAARRTTDSHTMRGVEDPAVQSGDPDEIARQRELASEVPDSPALGRPMVEDPSVVEARRKNADGIRSVIDDESMSGFDDQARNALMRHTNRINKLNYTNVVANVHGRSGMNRRADMLIAQENLRYQREVEEISKKREAKRIQELKKNPKPTNERFEAREAERKREEASKQPLPKEAPVAGEQPADPPKPPAQGSVKP